MNVLHDYGVSRGVATGAHRMVIRMDADVTTKQKMEPVFMFSSQ